MEEINVVRQLVHTRQSGPTSPLVIGKWANAHTIARELNVEVNDVPRAIANKTGSEIEISSESFVIQSHDGSWRVIPVREITEIIIEYSTNVEP